MILSNKYLFNHNIGDATEAEQVVMQAATLVLAENREIEFYPTADDIKGDDRINLAVSDACSIAPMRNCFATITSVCNLLNSDQYTVLYVNTYSI